MNEQEATELYRRYRPKLWKEVVGQNDAIRSIVDLVKRGAIPHAILLSGPSGVGKTTIARILKERLDCSDSDFRELNTADFRGIDMVRDIRDQMCLAPLQGGVRLWLIDECQQLTGDAQNALLKLLEDTPKHVYFILCTTDPQKLKSTIRTRCTEFRLVALSEKDLRALVDRVAEGEGIEICSDAADKIAELAGGSARKALVLLHQAIGLPVDKQLDAIQKGDYTAQGIELARLLVPGRGKPRANWKQIAAVLEGLEEEVETVRQIVLGYARSALVKGWADSTLAANVLQTFCHPFWEAGQGNAPAAALTIACWKILQDSSK